MSKPKSERDPQDDAADIVAARAGSADALGKLLDRFRHYLLDIANSEIDEVVRAKVGASDLVQDTFLEAHRIFPRFDGKDPNELRAWLRAILLNKLATATRQFRDTAKRQAGREVDLNPEGDRKVDLADSGPTPSRMMMAHERADALQAALLRLPEHYRQLIIWRQADDLSFEEIAQRLGKSVEAARKIWARAIQHLQMELGDSL